MFFKWAKPSNTRLDFVCIPYITGLTKPLTRPLRNDGLRVVTKPYRTSQQEFPSPKLRPPIDLQTNVVYKIPCNGCSWNYVGETGRSFLTRKKKTTLQECQEKYCSKGSNIANHAWTNYQLINFENYAN